MVTIAITMIALMLLVQQLWDTGTERSGTHLSRLSCPEFSPTSQDPPSSRVTLHHPSPKTKKHNQLLDFVGRLNRECGIEVFPLRYVTGTMAAKGAYSIILQPAYTFASNENLIHTLSCRTGCWFLGLVGLDFEVRPNMHG